MYDDSFYDAHYQGSYESALRILSILQEIIDISSIIDVGCGSGSWLHASLDLGINDRMGWDGAWAKKYAQGRYEFVAVDLNTQLVEKSLKKYDLCISMEVAEHLRSHRAVDYINTLCQLSDVVLFSAAIPAQGGTNHVNEQWQSYWSELFSARGFYPSDLVRRHVWNDPSVVWWYRQNTILYIRTNNNTPSQIPVSSDIMLDVVHPENYKLKINGTWQMPVVIKRLLKRMRR